MRRDPLTNQAFGCKVDVRSLRSVPTIEDTWRPRSLSRSDLGRARRRYP